MGLAKRALEDSQLVRNMYIEALFLCVIAAIFEQTVFGELNGLVEKRKSMFNCFCDPACKSSYSVVQRQGPGIHH